MDTYIVFLFFFLAFICRQKYGIMNLTIQYVGEGNKNLSIYEWLSLFLAFIMIILQIINMK